MLMMLMARCSLKSFFFVTLLANNTVEGHTGSKGPYFKEYGTVISQ